MNKLTIPAALLGLMAASFTAFTEADSMEEGRKIYEATCARCHSKGIMDAPVTDNPDEWADRGDVTWTEVKTEHLDEGFLRDSGKKAVSDHDIEVATAYMKTLLE